MSILQDDTVLIQCVKQASLAHFITNKKKLNKRIATDSFRYKYLVKVCEIQLMAAIDDMKYKYDAHHLKQYETVYGVNTALP